MSLLVFSVAIVLVENWPALLIFVAIAIVAIAVSRISPGDVSRMLAPVYAMAAFSVVFNVAALPDAQGLLRGLFFAVRMIALVAASFVVCLTTSSAELVEAFSWFIAPLRRLRVPVDDIAFTLALSIRFIPVIEREFAVIRAAQVSRGAMLGGSLVRTARNLAIAFSSLFIGLFRHADALSRAMDARCYGACEKRTRLR